MSKKEVEYWKQSYEKKAKDYAELENTYKEFQQSSHEFENELEEELANAQIDADRLKSRAAKAEAQMRKAREEADLLRKQSADEIAALQEKLADTGAAGSLQQIQKLMQEKNEVARRAAEEVNDMQEELDQMREQYELLETELEEMRDSYEESLDDLKHQVRDAKADALKAGSGGGSGGNDKAVEIIDSLNAEIQQLNARVDALNQDKDQLEARLLEESELNEELTGEVSDLTDDFMANSDRIEELEAKLQEALDALDAAKSGPAPPADEPASHGDTASVDPATLKKLQAAQASTGHMQEQIAQLQDELKNANELNEELQNEVTELTSQTEETVKSMQETETKQAELEHAKSELESKIQQLEEELFEANSKLSEAQAVAEHAQSKMDSAEESVRLQAKDGQERLMEVTRERDTLQMQLEVQKELEAQYAADLEKKAAELKELKDQQKREKAIRTKAREEKLQVSKNSALAKLAKGKKKGPGAAVARTLGAFRGAVSGMATDVEENSEWIVNAFTQLRSSMGEITTQLKSAQKNYKDELSKRKKLFDNLQDIKGNIKVFCRVRPLLKKEIKGGVQDAIEFPGHNQVSLLMNDSSGRGSAHNFTFDRVYSSLVDQKEVFDDVERLVLSVMDGYNVCIFAYGQTGSGKTYTMEGPKNNRGVNFRAVGAIFRQARKMAPQWTFKVYVSLVEIYNERLADLLDSKSVKKLSLEEEKDPKGDKDNLQIRKGPNGMYVSGVKSLQVRSAEDVLDVIAMGNKNRQTATTNANEHSSRSHSILMVHIDGIDNVTQNRVHGRLHLVDLAGSERVKNTDSSGQRLVEATYINKSLSALGDVMTALSNNKKKSHVPYRNSKLTYLLQDSLGGNSKTMMFVNCSAADKSAQETLCSLQFAKRVRKVKLNATASVENAALKKYRNEVDELAQNTKALKDNLKKTKKRYEEKMKDKDDIIYQLNKQLKAKSHELNAVELAKKKEISELTHMNSKLSKMASHSSGKSTEDRLKRKHEELTEKYQHVQQLLKLSQRENKSLKQQANKGTKKNVEKKYKAATSKARQLEEKMDKLSRRARVEALARKRAEESSANAEEKWRRQLEDKDQIIRALRSKNKKLLNDVQSVKVHAKRQEVQSFYHGSAPRAAWTESTPENSALGNSQLDVPREWTWGTLITNIRGVVDGTTSTRAALRARQRARSRGRT